jgi:hypothetical protein
VQTEHNCAAKHEVKIDQAKIEEHCGTLIELGESLAQVKISDRCGCVFVALALSVHYLECPAMSFASTASTPRNSFRGLVCLLAASKCTLAWPRRWTK